MHRLGILVLKNKCASQKQMAGVLAINVKKVLRHEPSSGGRKGNPHEKLHIRLREMFGFPPQINSSKALFETQERSWNSAWNHFVVTRRLDLGARRLSRCLIYIQICVASDLFFLLLILAQKCLGFRSDFLMSAPRHVGFRAYF